MLVVAGVYAHRAIRAARARKNAPPSIPESVQQQSAEFSYVGTDQGRALFTIRASHATQYKDQNRALLQDVWITIYGHDGSRNDNIHTRECNYEPASGNVVCEGDVKIDLASAAPAGDSGKPADKTLQVTTRNLSFNRESGDATTTAPVQFRFPQGEGHCDGMIYSSQKEIVRLSHNVQLDLAASDKSGGLPVTATGGSMEISRNDRMVQLDAPANVRQGGRTISADKISIELDAEFRARHAIATGHPQVTSADPRGKSTSTATQFDLFLNPDGWIERVVADGNVEGSREATGAADHFTAGNVVLNMTSQHNLLREMTATGNVKANSRMGSESRSIETESLLATFTSGQHPGQHDDHQVIQTVSTLAPGTIETKSADETTNLHAKRFVAQFAPTGRLDTLLGHGGATVSRKIGSAPPQIIKAAELAAKFSPDGEWQQLDETGDVHFQQADRQASADRANIVRSTELILLDGSPVLTDSMSRTTASSVAINQKSGDIRASGGVLSTYFPSAQNSAMSLGSGPGHISAATLTGSTTSGQVTYVGHARLWQGDSVLEANQIEIWRDEKKLQATGNVVANFPQAAPPAQPPANPSPAPSTRTISTTPSGPTLWQIRAPTLTYWGDSGKAHLEPGVTADSQQGSMQSRTLDVFLTPASDPARAKPSSAGAKTTPAPTGNPAEGRQLDHALALGGVTVRQGDRRGTADQAEYTAADGKFVLSGGQPTIIDASSDTTTGHSLTFFVANDTILIDSQDGSRTLTKHRVEK